VFWKSGDDEVDDEFDIVIVAGGLGVERTVNDLPLTSYWRVDALAQPALARTSQRIIISGAGDGALIDILRATIRDFDHATFYEEVIQGLRDVQPSIDALEKKAWTKFLESYGRPGDKSDHVKKNEALESAEPVLTAGYKELAGTIRQCLEQDDRRPINPDFSICWLSPRCEYEVTAFPLNRLLSLQGHPGLVSQT